MTHFPAIGDVQRGTSNPEPNDFERDGRAQPCVRMVHPSEGGRLPLAPAAPPP